VRSRPRGSHPDSPPSPGPRGLGDGLRLPHPSEEANLAIVTGTILAEPTRDRSRGDEPVTVILLGLKAPDVDAPDQTACLEVEAIDPVADPHRPRLREGLRLVVLGRLTGVGLWATALVSATPTPHAPRTIGRQ
jgi:hypothetical protein